MGKDYKGPVENSIEMAVEEIESQLKHDYAISKRAIALLLLQEDEEIKNIVKDKEPEVLPKIDEIVSRVKSNYANHISYELALERQNRVQEIITRVVRVTKNKISFRERLSRMTMNPVSGFPIMFLVLYFGLYKFVGELGAGVVVNFLEEVVFDKYLNPFAINIFNSIIPWRILQELFVGEYGIVTMGFKYAVALILPIIAFFFVIFSVIEDTGYLPRLAMLIDRTFKKIGLSGRAVIPMVLGLGCDTMATMVTRTLPTKRERIIATMLLALAVPCSAQLGVIMALLAGRPKAMLVWAGIIMSVFLIVGYLTAKILPGERPSFYMEIPTLRMPKISNVLTKTYLRVKWYFKEVLPLFLVVSFFIWLGKLTRIFDFIIAILQKPIELLGLPPKAAEVFVFGFFRRDYGAAGLYDLNKHNALTNVQLVVACVALTLFLPCIAQFLMNVKERGWKMAIFISTFVLFSSFTVAYIVNLVLTRIGAAL